MRAAFRALGEGVTEFGTALVALEHGVGFFEGEGVGDGVLAGEAGGGGLVSLVHPRRQI